LPPAEDAADADDAAEAEDADAAGPDFADVLLDGGSARCDAEDADDSGDKTGEVGALRASLAAVVEAVLELRIP
jgi:hypothetical protein